MITIKMFVFNPFQVNTYVLHDETLSCIIIDPAFTEPDEKDMLFKYININKLEVKGIVLTHGHIDHLLGLDTTVKSFNVIPVIHKNDFKLVEFASSQAQLFSLPYQNYNGEWLFINENDIIEFGNSLLKVLHVPGHSGGSIAIYSYSDDFVITGDTLFKGSIGRTDLFDGNFQQLTQSIKNKLFTLPPHTLIFPGHGQTSEIKNEIKYNPFLN